ncbi:MAG: hypothetical protein WC069_00185 [Candidatus Shapirobacteria bacterium]
MNDISQHIKTMLVLGYEASKHSQNLGKGIGKINTNGEETIELDKILEDLFIGYIKKNNLLWNIFSEEIGWIKFHPNPEFTIAFDPLDGSANYKYGKGLLPYGTLMAVYSGINPKLNDVVASGAMEFTLGKGYLFDGKETKDFDGNKIVLKNDWEINHSTPIQIDLYHKENFDKFSILADKLHIRWSGSVIGGLMYVLENSNAVFGAPMMKPEEIGAVTSLIMGAGGKIIGINNNDFMNLDFDTERKYALIGGGEKVVDFVKDNM